MGISARDDLDGSTQRASLEGHGPDRRGVPWSADHRHRQQLQRVRPLQRPLPRAGPPHPARASSSRVGSALEFPVTSLGEPFIAPTTMLFRNLMAMDVEEVSGRTPWTRGAPGRVRQDDPRHAHGRDQRRPAGDHGDRRAAAQRRLRRSRRRELHRLLAGCTTNYGPARITRGGLTTSSRTPSCAATATARHGHGVARWPRSPRRSASRCRGLPPSRPSMRAGARMAEASRPSRASIWHGPDYRPSRQLMTRGSHSRTRSGAPGTRRIDQRGDPPHRDRGTARARIRPGHVRRTRPRRHRCSPTSSRQAGT